MPHLLQKFHQNPFITFRDVLQTNEHTDRYENIASLGDVLIKLKRRMTSGAAPVPLTTANKLLLQLSWYVYPSPGLLPVWIT